MSQQEDQPNGTAAVEVPPEHLRFAAILQSGVWLALAWLFGSYLLYLTGLVPAAVPTAEVTRYWELGHAAFAAATGWPHGWTWLSDLPAADMLCLLGIAALAGLSSIALLAVLPIYIRRRDWPFVGVTIGVLVVIGLAATGLVAKGH